MTKIILTTAAGDPIAISSDQNGKLQVTAYEAELLDPPEFDDLIFRTMFDEIVKLRGAMPDGFPAQDEKRANSLKNAPSETPTNFTAALTDIAEGVNAIAQHLRESEAPTRAAIDAERAWETAMMAEIGEDGIAGVVEAIRKLKRDKTAADIANGTLRIRAEGLQRDLTVMTDRAEYNEKFCGFMHRLLLSMQRMINGGWWERIEAKREIAKIEAELEAFYKEHAGAKK